MDKRYHQPPDQRHDGGRKPTAPPPKPADAYSSVATMSSALLAAHIQIRDLEREAKIANDAFHALVKQDNEREAETQRLREALRISYPMTPVDCLISELREIFVDPSGSRMDREVFEERVAQFKDEVKP